MLIPVLLLLSLGILVINSSSQTLAFQQILFSIFGLMAYFLVSNFDYRALRSVTRFSYFLVLFLLIVTFILGIETRGSVRWIPIGPFNFQPSEFAKPVLILALAYFWSNRLASWKNIGLSLLILVPVAILIFRQPDLGTTLTVCFIWISILISANISLIKLGVLGLLGSLIAPISWYFLHDYQRQRVFSFLYPSQDPLGTGYNVIQSTIAVGSGQLFGRGLGRGTQSHLQFLPEFRTDFIFASIAEELGMIGSLIMLGLYLILLSLIFRVLFKASDRLGELIIIGVISMLVFQIIVNIGMNIGIMPVTGITLPFLSYGGSSIISIFICLGLVGSINRLRLTTSLNQGII